THSKPSRRISLRVRLRAPTETKPRRPGNSMAQKIALPPNGTSCTRALGAVVVMVILAPPTVSVKEQDASNGRFEQVNETPWLNPPSGVMASVVVPLRPGAVAVTVAGFAAIWKSTTLN